ncbi:MAG: hypothetical protein LBS18_00945 [Clostridiales bacterium]|jgi:energy-coupling factor transport system substrate-specific component|nr:hypothetical protein [Clostridiales bacterium]
MRPAKRVAVLAACGALLITVQVSLAFLPNIELVSLLLVIFTLHLHAYVLAPLAVFIVVEGLLYGFGIWWAHYLYVWPLWVLFILANRNKRSAAFWALAGGAFGLAFGALCALTYLFTGGVHTAMAYFISGIPFDIAHCAGNVITALVLFRPLMRLGDRLFWA